MGRLTELKTETEKRKRLKTILGSDEHEEVSYPAFWDDAQVKQTIENYTDDIITTCKESKRGQIRELGLEIVSKVFGISISALKKNLFEQDRAVEFEVNIFINNRLYQSWKI